MTDRDTLYIGGRVKNDQSLGADEPSESSGFQDHYRQTDKIDGMDVIRTSGWI